MGGLRRRGDDVEPLEGARVAAQTSWSSWCADAEEIADLATVLAGEDDRALARRRSWSAEGFARRMASQGEGGAPASASPPHASDDEDDDEGAGLVGRAWSPTSTLARSRRLAWRPAWTHAVAAACIALMAASAAVVAITLGASSPRGVAGAAALAAPAAGAPTLSPTDAAPGLSVVAPLGVRLRQEPSTQAAVIRVLPAGTMLTVLDSNAGWDRVRAGTDTGWVLHDASLVAPAGPGG